MATTATPYGFRPVGTLNGSYAGRVRLMKMTNSYGTSVFYGDPVILVAAGTVERATVTLDTALLGVFLGCTYTDPGSGQKTWNKIWRASTSATDNYAYVCDDPDTVFAVQSNGTVAQADLGLNANINALNVGSTVTGMSAIALHATMTTATTALFKIVGFQQGPLSAVGDAKTDVLVTINTHRYRALSGI